MMDVFFRKVCAILVVLLFSASFVACDSPRVERLSETSPGPVSTTEPEAAPDEKASAERDEGDEKFDPEGIRFDEDGDTILGLPELGEAPEGSVWHPVGVPPDYGCEDVAATARVFTEYLHLIFDGASELEQSCVWSDDPEADIASFDGPSASSVEVWMRIDVWKHWTPEFVEDWCALFRSASETSFDIGDGECADGSFADDRDDKRLDLTSAYVGVSLTVTCGESETCSRAQLPAEFSEDAGLEAIAEIADAVRGQLEFREIDLTVGEVEDEIELVTNWAEQDFPDRSTAPGWFCTSTWETADATVEIVKQTNELYDVDWDISGADLEYVIPEVYVNFQNAQIAYAVSVIPTGYGYCISDVAERTRY